MRETIALPRSLLEMEAMRNPIRLRLWLMLLYEADDNGTVEITTRTSASKYGLSRQQLRDAVKCFESTHLITHVSTHVSTHITICDYERYKGVQPANQPKEQPTKQPTVTTKISSDTLNETPTMKAKTVRYEAPEKLDFETIRTQLLFDTPWQESMLRTLRLTEAELSDAIERYPDHCRAIGEPRKTLKEAKYHIANWLRRQKYSSHQTSYDTKREDRFSERRGTDPSANRAEDYPTAL